MTKFFTLMVLVFLISCSDNPPVSTVTTEPEYSATLLTKYSERRPKSKEFLFQPTKKGYYVIDIWQHIHRDEDRLHKRLHLQIEQLPYTENIVVPSDTHRVEIIYATTPMLASTLSFPDHQTN
jgi:hypothetical protein